MKCGFPSVCYHCYTRQDHIFHDNGTPVSGALLPSAPSQDSRNTPPPVVVEPVTKEKDNGTN